MNNETLLDMIDPEVAGALVSRREAIRKGAAVSSLAAASFALGSIPLALGALATEAGAQGTASDVLAVLKFAGDVCLVVILHNDINTVRPASDRPAHFDDLKTVFRAHPDTTIIWAHTGLGRFVKPTADHVDLLREIVGSAEFSHVSFDISWDDDLATVGGATPMDGGPAQSVAVITAAKARKLDSSIDYLIIHQKLMYAGPDRVYEVCRQSNIRIIETLDEARKIHCEACLLGKATAMPSRDQPIPAKRFLSMVY